MIKRKDFVKEMLYADEFMHSGNMDKAGEIYNSQYALLRMDSYRYRLSQVQFEKVFDGLTPDEVLPLLLKLVCWQLNTCRTKEALEIIRQFKMIERDFLVHCDFDFKIDKCEIVACCRLGNNEKAMELCDHLLKKDISHSQKVEILIAKGTIECDESHQVFGINCLSLALAEAEADGNPSLIAMCYLEMAKMIGLHFPALSLSFLWKARLFYEKISDKENVTFCKTRMALSYFLLFHKSQQKEVCFMNEALRLINEDVKREDFRHPAGQYSYDRDKGLLNNNLQLIEKSIDFFEGIKAYGEVYRSAEFYIKTALAVGDREAAKYGAQRYEEAAREMNDQNRVNYIKGIDLEHAVACWVPKREQKELPDLLDVLELIAHDEEWFHLRKDTMRLLFPTHYQEGMFEAVLMPNGRTHLYPCTLYPMRYFRGQSDRLEGKKCKPSIYRGLPEATMFKERLSQAELDELLADYPLTKIYEGNLMYNTPDGPKPMFLNVDTIALGQHYGIKTDVLDLTADKWVAAFFAATEYKNGEYKPCRSDGVGVVYIYTELPEEDPKKNRLSAVGLQPFSRPGCQAGMVYKMLPEEDFNDKAKRYFFRHDAAISELIYNYCNRSKKLFPDEVLEEKVNAIRASKKYSRHAFEKTVNTYYKDKSEEDIEKYIDELGIEIIDDVTVTFTESELSCFEEKWKKEQAHFFDNVIVRLCCQATVVTDDIKDPTK